MATRQARTTTVALGNGSEAKAHVSDHPDQDARVVIERDGERWAFGVDGREAELETTTEAGDVLDLPEPPAWAETVLWEIGLSLRDDE
ncbi:hypothetical protein ACFQL1_14965 [Halomicroarcula sp. GCM10025709]|uniref:hypothetical protein n=1 Tax=Haloarcula TaxID=2237 RepID=UPI0024C3F01A|nr:hypothetical protein [Halomicroarcula sp. YJ-61-S]